VNAGSGAERVVADPVPPPVVPGAGVVGVVVVAEDVVFGFELVCVGVRGALETVTVFVPEPQAASSAAQPAPSAAAITVGRVLVIVRCYSPPARPILNIYFY
jgi:hypothetical protein